MKIHVLQENLLKALTQTGRIIPSKPQLPILQNVLLTTEEGRLTVTASNLETTEVNHIGVKIEKEGGICVSSRLLTEFISSLPQGSLELSVEEGNLNISGLKVHADIPGIASSEYPAVSKVAEKNRFGVPKKVFNDALKMVLFASATDEARPILSGIRIHTTDGETTFAATDGYRLSVKRVPLVTKQILDMIVPSRALAEVLKITSEDKEEEIEMGVTEDSQLVFMTQETQIFTRLIDGEFPPYNKIVPKTHTTQMTVEREEFHRAVKTAAIFARDNANIIRLKVDSSGTEISANTPQVGKNTVSLDATVEGDGGEIAFNSRFLLEILANFPTDRVVFQMTGALNPGVFLAPEDDSFLHIIMPVRVQS